MAHTSNEVFDSIRPDISDSSLLRRLLLKPSHRIQLRLLIFNNPGYMFYLLVRNRLLHHQKVIRNGINNIEQALSRLSFLLFAQVAVLRKVEKFHSQEPKINRAFAVISFSQAPLRKTRGFIIQLV